MCSILNMSCETIDSNANSKKGFIGTSKLKANLRGKKKKLLKAELVSFSILQLGRNIHLEGGIHNGGDGQDNVNICACW